MSTESISRFYLVNEGGSIVIEVNVGFPAEIEVSFKHLDQKLLSGKYHRSIKFKQGVSQVSSHNQFPIKHAF
jgi:hypothetical protein